MTQTPDFDFEFDLENKSYHVRAWHHTQLSIRERFEYRMVENTYLVFLDGFKPFEIFIGEDLEWHTTSTFIVTQDLVDKIGEWIDRKSK